MEQKQGGTFVNIMSITGVAWIAILLAILAVVCAVNVFRQDQRQRRFSVLMLLIGFWSLLTAIVALHVGSLLSSVV
jgi:hypothetical protein